MVVTDRSFNPLFLAVVGIDAQQLCLIHAWSGMPCAGMCRPGCRQLGLQLHVLGSALPLHDGASGAPVPPDMDARVERVCKCMWPLTPLHSLLMQLAKSHTCPAVGTAAASLLPL
jgi:hypothetical protein